MIKRPAIQAGLSVSFHTHASSVAEEGAFGQPIKNNVLPYTRTTISLYSLAFSRILLYDFLGGASFCARIKVRLRA